MVLRNFLAACRSGRAANLAALALFASACASTAPDTDLAEPSAPGVAAPPSAAPTAAPVEPPSAPADAAAAPTAPTAAAAAPVASSRSADEAALWNDPLFRRRFTESYLGDGSIEPRITSLEREPMQKVFDLMAKEKNGEALALLEKLREPATTAVYDFMAGNLRAGQEELDAAAAAYELAVEKHPNFRNAWKNLGKLRWRQERYADAQRCFTREIELGGGDAFTYGLLGVAYSNAEHYLAAESAFRQAMVLDPVTLDWQTGLARSFLKQRRFADAVSLYDTLLAKHPERADLWSLQALAWIGLQQPLRAAENYEIVGRLGGATPDTLYSLGDIYLNEGLHDLATDAYVEALDRSPTGSVARTLRALKFLTGRGAFAEARRLVVSIELVRAGNLAADERTELLRLRARLAAAEGAIDEEVRVLEELVAADPLDGGSMLQLGENRKRTGDLERAVLWFERAANLPDFEAEAKLQHARLLASQQRYAEALPLLRRAQTLKPRDAVQEFLERLERAQQARG